jgi:alpha/beta superfamily hydrolase
MPWREQTVTVPVDAEGLILEGVWQAGTERAAVIAPPHPQYGGNLEHPVVNEIAFALHKEGFASLRFNWRGTGASQGVPTGERGAAERDYRAAVDYVRQNLSVSLTGAGYSFGAATALAVALHDERIRALLLVAPPIQMLRDLAIEQFPGPVSVIVGGDDAFAPVQRLSEILEPLSNARLDVIPRADHFFATAGLADLSQLVRAAVE